MTEIQMKLVKGNYVYQSEAGDRDFGYIFLQAHSIYWRKSKHLKQIYRVSPTY